MGSLLLRTFDAVRLQRGLSIHNLFTGNVSLGLCMVSGASLKRLATEIMLQVLVLSDITVVTVFTSNRTEVLCLTYLWFSLIKHLSHPVLSWSVARLRSILLSLWYNLHFICRLICLLLFFWLVSLQFVIIFIKLRLLCGRFLVFIDDSSGIHFEQKIALTSLFTLLSSTLSCSNNYFIVNLIDVVNLLLMFLI